MEKKMAKKSSKEEINKKEFINSHAILEEMRDKVNKHYGRRVMLIGSEKAAIKKLQTGIFSFDYETGGMPRGRWIILVGDPSTFKSSTFYAIGSANQRICGNCMKGKITEINHTKIKIPCEVSKETRGILGINSDGEIISELYLADGKYRNVYCPGEPITHTRDLMLLKYDLECSVCQNPSYSVFVLIDTEHNYTKSWARKFGVIHHYIALGSTTYSQMIGDIGRHALDTGRVCMLGVDSLDAQGPKEEDEKSIEEWDMGLQARVWNKITRIVTSKLNTTYLYEYINKDGKIIKEERWPEPTIVIIQQWRQKIGGYGNPKVMGGGYGKNFASSITIEFSEGDKDWEMTGGTNSKKDFITGLWFNFFVKKSKVDTPYKKGSFYFDVINSNIDNSRSIIQYALKFNLIQQAGAWFTYGENRFQGMNRMIKFFNENPKELDKLKNIILKKKIVDD